MSKLGLGLTSGVLALLLADPLPFTGTWRMRPAENVGQIFRTEVRNGVYTCSPCADPINNMRVDGADHAVPDSPDTYSIRAIGKQGVEVVRKSKGKILMRSIRSVSDDGRHLDILTVEDLPDGDIVWTLYKREHVGQPVAGVPISGEWKQVSAEYSSNTLTFSYEQTADTLKMKQGGTSYEAKFDGKDYPVQGAPSGSTVRLRRIDDRTIEERWMRNGGEESRALMKVSANGKTLTQTGFLGSAQTGSPQVADRLTPTPAR